jgi:hypothetical protein
MSSRNVVEAGRRDRTYVMKTTRVHRLGEADRVSSAFDVGEFLSFGAGVDVVERGKVKDVLDLSLELGDLGFRHAEVGFREIAHDGDNPSFIGVPDLAQ